MGADEVFGAQQASEETTDAPRLGGEVLQRKARLIGQDLQAAGVEQHHRSGCGPSKRCSVGCPQRRRWDLQAIVMGSFYGEIGRGISVIAKHGVV